LQAHVDDAALCFEEQVPGAAHPLADKILRGRQARGALEHAAEVVLAQLGDLRQMGEAEVAVQMLIHRIDDSAQLVRLERAAASGSAGRIEVGANQMHRQRLRQAVGEQCAGLTFVDEFAAQLIHQQAHSIIPGA
jgi:hypothetical protein